MKRFYTKHLHRLWMLCLCLSIMPGSLIYAGNRIKVRKNPSSPINYASVNSGDTVVIVGDLLTTSSPNDWWELSQQLFSKSLVIELQTENQSIPQWTFVDKTNLTGIILPNVETLEDGAFARTGLTSVSLPNVKTLGNYALIKCEGLTELDLPNVISVGNGAMDSCLNVLSISLPNAETIGNWAIQKCAKLTSIDFPNVKTVGEYSFQLCTNLSSVNLPKATNISNGAFFNCPNLTDVDVPNVESIGWEAFQHNTSLASISFPKVISVGGNAFSNCPALANVDLPEAVTIGNGAFHQCSSLTNINYPNVQTIGDWAFLGTNLTSVVLPNVLSIGDYAFENTNITTLSIPRINSIQTGTFKNCTGLTYLYMPDVTSLVKSTFDGCTNLEVVLFPNLSHFGDSVFNNCPSLKYMELGAKPTMPASPKSAFGGTTGPVLIVVPDTNAYGPALSYTHYSPGSEVHLRRVSTEARMFDPNNLETLTALRSPSPNAALVSHGTFVWKKDGYPISGANSSSYTPTEPGWYTLEFTHGGTVVLRSVYLAAETVEVQDSRARYADCSYNLVLTFTPSGADRTVTVSTKGSGAAYMRDVASGKLFKDNVTYKLPKNKTMLEIPYEVIPGMGDNNQVQFEWEVSDFPIVYDTDVFTLYDVSEITYRYYRPTANFSGLLEVYITGGSLYMERSLDGGVTWEPARDLVTGEALPFTKSEIYNLESYLLFRQPNTCFSNDTLDLRNNHEPTAILREVLMPSVTDAICSVEAGEHYLESRKDFTFTLTGLKSGYSPRISTDRVIYPDNAGGLLVERNEDGSYTVTILYVQEPTVVTIDFTVGNNSIEGTRVWGADGVLHLQSVESCEALIHTLSGALVQHVRLSAGEDFSQSLTKGCYLVTIGKKTYKVIL